MITCLPASERIAQPWKNGGGITREIAVYPVGAGIDDFLWRISMAEITQAGPFSHFEGVDRHLTVLSGSLRMDLPDRRHLLHSGDSLAFAGDVPIQAAPILPVTDLNVMTRQEQMRAEVRRISAGVILPSDRVILLATAPMSVTANGRRYSLATYDALMFEDLSEEPISITAEGYLIAFR